jgi:CubicO group peptidase (beta-lactamase class C family)
VLIAGSGVGVVYVGGMPLLSIGAAYKAKMLCSEVFVAGRAVEDVMADLQIDDLRPLRFVGAHVNQTAGTTRAGLPGLVERRARFRGALGCTLNGQPTVTDGVGDRVPWPGKEVASPASNTLAALAPDVRRAVEAVLDEAFSEPDLSRPRRTRAVVVMQHGHVVAERYAAGIGSDTPLAGWSMTKSVLNALMGIAVREGRLELNGPVPLQAWSTPGDPRSRISVSDLLRMSSGLSFDENQAAPSSDILRMLFDTDDMAAFAASREPAHEPGTSWQYSSGTSMLLSRLLREAVGDGAYHEFPRRMLFEPLGMHRAVLEVDASGTFVASSYMYATAREWARFGQLYLQDGVWMGQRILPEGWVAFTRMAAPADPHAAYGAHFWLSTPVEYRGPDAAVPDDAFHAAGHEAQFVTIVPSRGVVIVRLGRTRYPSAWAHNRFVAAVLSALQPRASPTMRYLRVLRRE